MSRLHSLGNPNIITPVLAIDGKIVSMGKALSVDEVKKVITKTICWYSNIKDLGLMSNMI
jgi:hypothetical protein